LNKPRLQSLLPSINMVQIHEASIETGSAANQVLASSTELEKQATTLQEQVGDFLGHLRAA
jgi:methyl-accepting chemotaxis protein